MAKIRGKLQAAHWRVAARGLRASETAMKTVKRDVSSRQLSEVRGGGCFEIFLTVVSQKRLVI